MASKKTVIFQTVATELVEYAEAAFTYFNQRGYRCKIEPSELGYPKTPALVCKRNHTTVVVEVFANIDMAILKQWLAFCKSATYDLRVALCIPHDSTIKYLPKCQAECQERGIGIYVCHNSSIAEWHAPQDISLNLELPEISSLPRATRVLLGPAYEQFDRGQWREGFQEACKALESKAKPYLIKSIQTTRLKIYSNGVVKNPTSTRINKMTLGQLAEAFGAAQAQNLTDSIIHKTLVAINPERVGVAHNINKARTENQLRKKVGQHMHAIIQALKALS